MQSGVNWLPICAGLQQEEGFGYYQAQTIRWLGGSGDQASDQQKPQVLLLKERIYIG